MLLGTEEPEAAVQPAQTPLAASAALGGYALKVNMRNSGNGTSENQLAKHFRPLQRMPLALRIITIIYSRFCSMRTLCAHVKEKRTACVDMIF